MHKDPHDDDDDDDGGMQQESHGMHSIIRFAAQITFTFTVHTHNASTSTHIVWPRAHAIVLHSVMACQQFVHCQIPALTALSSY